MRNIDQERELHQKIDQKIYDLLVLSNALLSAGVVALVVWVIKTVIAWFA
jgi:hypothetical protein